MVDFGKKIHNSNKFREAALFFKEHGAYTLAPRGTTDYIQYWERETDRCLNGYVAPDGDSITGYHYFYLNYSPIMKLMEVEYTDRYGNKRTRRERMFDFPSFWDGDYYYFNAIEEAEQTGKHMAVLKCRQRGFSFKGASMLVRNYELIKGSKNFAVASEQKFLIGDGILTKAWQIMDFVDKHTEWSKQRLTSTRMERVSGYKVTDEFGKLTEQGYLSAITGITLKNDPERLRGTRGKLVLFEEAGKFPSLETAWRVEQPAVETDDGVAFGLLCCFGTGGTEGGQFDGLKKMFYNPDAFNILAFDNIWEGGAEGSKCGFFAPAYYNLEDAYGKFMDEDGNSKVDEAIENLIAQRNKIREGGATQESIDRFIAERPIKPSEAILELGKNIFPRKLLMDLLTKIRTNTKLKNMKHVVDLMWDGNGSVKAVEKKLGDITHYPLNRDDKQEGSVVIWEYPIPEAPFGLYIAGCLTPGEKVQTARGLINVEDVTLNDSLFNLNGEYVNIRNIQVYEKSNEDIYTIKPYGSYRTTTFTKEHPILTSDGFKKAKDINKDCWLEIPNVYHSDKESYLWTQGDDLRDRKYAYFLGLFAGDGFTNINGKSYDIYMSIGKDEKEFAEFYDNLVLDLFGRKCVHVHKQTELTRRFTHRGLVDILDTSIGISAYTKRVPEFIKRGSYGVKMAFLQGFLDTDGSVFYDGGKVRVNFTSVNLELMEDIQDILYGLEIKNSIVIHLKDTTNRFGIHSQQSYRINISREDNKKLAFNPVYESRKIKLLRLSEESKGAMKIRFCENKVYLKVEGITKSTYSGFVYNFECDTHTFGCRCIMTHNCDPLNLAGLKLGKNGERLEQKTPC